MNYFWKHTKSTEHSINRAGSVLMLLDFDGTLSPIVSTPARAKLPKATKDILLKLVMVNKIRLGIISGRQLDDVKKKVDIKNIVYSGNHGMEWKINGRVFRKYLTLETTKILKSAEEELEGIKNRFPGSLVEDKGLSLAFHYRRVLETEKSLVEKLLDEKLAKYLKTGRVSLIKENFAYDLRGNCGWTKGSVTSELKRKLGSSDGLLIYMGDSATDEDVFSKLKGDVTIKIGSPRGSRAKYYLKDPEDVQRFLIWVANVLLVKRVE